ncbi:homoserine dehydrogenase [bacterium]|jgi:homoserine dehydrogenase|nr:homoserine dehydrogenase [bacterium]
MNMDKKEVLNVGLIGLGNVGYGVLRILADNAEMIRSRVGYGIDVKAVVVRDPSKYADSDLGGAKLTTDVADVLEDDSIDVVVEVMGGEEPALDYICRALKSKKYVVTANKEVIAKHKTTFFELAKANDVDIYFEAAVGGGIPVIRSYKVGYAANQMESIYGILNGTTNYILTQIQEKQEPFEVILKKAQELGFAEADPHMDVSGLDAAYKLVILAAVAFKVDIQLEDVTYEGIESITLKDIKYADELGYVIKLLAIGQKSGADQMSFKVHPTLVLKEHPLASVRNEFNAVFSKGDAMGESMIYGKGAGGAPTGSAVVSDIIDIAFDTQQKNSRRNLEYRFDSVDVQPISESYSQFYLRMKLANVPGALGKVGDTFSECGVNVLTVIQKENVEDWSEVVVVTQRVQEGIMTKALAELEGLSEVREILSKIHVGLGEA